MRPLNYYIISYGLYSDAGTKTRPVPNNDLSQPNKNHDYCSDFFAVRSREILILLLEMFFII